MNIKDEDFETLDSPYRLKGYLRYKLPD